MSRFAKGSTTLFSLVTLILAALVVWRLLPTSAPAVRAQEPPAMSATDVQVALIRAGLDAEALAAAGLSSQEATAVVAAARTDLNSHLTRLSDADAAFASARSAADALGRKVQSGLATQQEIASYASAASTLESATSDRQAAVDATFSAGTQSLSGHQLAVLAAIRANRSHKLATEFLTVSHTDEEWLGLRNALSNERIAAKYGNEANGACQSLLSTARANQTVAAAKASMVANLTTVSTAWDSATSGN